MHSIVKFTIVLLQKGLCFRRGRRHGLVHKGAEIDTNIRVSQRSLVELGEASNLEVLPAIL